MPEVTSPEQQDQLFEQLFSPAQLTATFTAHFASSPSKGVDRLNGFQFVLQAVGDLTTASAGICAGRFRFSPYLEVLKAKGRDE